MSALLLGDLPHFTVVPFIVPLSIKTKVILQAKTMASPFLLNLLLYMSHNPLPCPCFMNEARRKEPLKGSSEWLFNLERPRSASCSSYRMKPSGGVPAVYKARYPGLFYPLACCGAARQRRENLCSSCVASL